MADYVDSRVYAGDDAVIHVEALNTLTGERIFPPQLPAVHITKPGGEVDTITAPDVVWLTPKTLYKDRYNLRIVYRTTVKGKYVGEAIIDAPYRGRVRFDFQVFG